MGLRESVDHDRALLHSRKGCDRYMILQISQFTVDLITEYIQIMLLNNFRHCLEICPLHDRTGRIVRERHNEQLGLRRDCCLKFLCRQTELILCLQFNNDRRSVCKNTARYIGYITRLRNQYFIARIQHRAHREINCLTSSDRHENFLVVIIMQIKSAIEILRDLNL